MEADNSQLSRKISVLEDENQLVKQGAEGLRVQLKEISRQHERCGSRISVLEERVTQADAGLDEEQGRCVCMHVRVCACLKERVAQAHAGLEQMQGRCVCVRDPHA